MKITVTAEQPVDEKLAAKVTVAAADVDKAIAKTYKDIANKYNFQGFRKGHAPRPVIDGIMGREAVLAQATNDLHTAVEPLLLEELDVTPVGRISFGEDPALAAQGSDYAVEATIGVRPSCELESYDAPEVNLPPEEATEAEVDWQGNQLLSYQTAPARRATSSPSTSRTSPAPATSRAPTACSPSRATPPPPSCRTASRA